MLQESDRPVSASATGQCYAPFHQFIGNRFNNTFWTSLPRAPQHKLFYTRLKGIGLKAETIPNTASDSRS